MTAMAGMAQSDEITVTVPATSANLGPGFDSLGLALTLRDEFTVSLGEPTSDSRISVEITGEGERTLPRDASNLMVTSFREAAGRLGLAHRAIVVHAHNRIPQGRGLGSSASAIVAGVAAAAGFAESRQETQAASQRVASQSEMRVVAQRVAAQSVMPTLSHVESATSVATPIRMRRQLDLDLDLVFNAAAAKEGHPDNVAPAVYGSLTAAYARRAETTDPGDGVAAVDVLGSCRHESDGHKTFGHVRYERLGDVHPWLFVPDSELSTRRARTVLPDQVPLMQAVFNVSRAAVLPAAMQCEDPACGNELLFDATQDALHQRRRESLMPDSLALMDALRRRGFAAVISGAGPCVLVLHYGRIDDGLRECASAWLKTGHWRILPLDIDRQGVTVTG